MKPEEEGANILVRLDIIGDHLKKAALLFAHRRAIRVCSSHCPDR